MTEKTEKTKAVRSKVEKNEAKKLVAELKHLYLREDSELLGRGLCQRLLANISILHPGHVDKDTTLVARIKEIILELEKIV